MKEIENADGQVQADGGVNFGVTMKRVPVTEDQIIEAGMSLEANGMPINGWSLRTRIGVCGNPRNLHQRWLSFRAKVIIAGKSLEADGMPINGWSLRMRIGDRGNPRLLHETWLLVRAKEQMASTEPPVTAPQEATCSIAVR